mmetsp:Transcript_39375/g.71672  ORF Transcript_39375/g.71672 Transcript_39375/m.71672 type:complete len:474 (-) Transcript_39375:167-1588(-)
MTSVVGCFLLGLAHLIATASGDAAVADATGLSAEQHTLVCYLKKELEQKFKQLHNFNGLRAAQDMSQKSCAIISSSGAMLDHRYGAEIDAHDVVFRFNDAPTARFERYVGNRTDVRVGWTTSDWLYGPAFYDISETEWNLLWRSIRVMYHLYPTNLGQKKNKAIPTTGFYGMLLAFTHCASVDSYEMYPSTFAAKAKYHYYGKPPTKVKELNLTWSANESNDHSDFAAEHDLWARLSLTPKDEVFQSGKTHMVGFSKVACQSSMADPGSLETTTIKRLPCPAERFNISLTLTGLSRCLSAEQVEELGMMVAYKLGKTEWHCVDVASKLCSDGVQKVVGTIATGHPGMFGQLTSSDYVQYVCGQVAPTNANCRMKTTWAALGNATKASNATKAAPKAVPVSSPPNASLRATQRLAESVPLQMTAGASDKQSGLPWWSWAVLGCSGAMAIVFCFVPLCAAPREQGGLEEDEQCLD